MTAQALLKTADLAMDLSTLEDSSSLEEAKDQVLGAAQVAQSLGDDAAHAAGEVFESILGIHHVSHPSTEQAFYYSSGEAARKSSHEAHKAEQNSSSHKQGRTQNSKSSQQGRSQNRECYSQG
jgi:hypothetical protein